MKNILTESTKSKFKVLEHKPANVLKRIQGVLSDFKSNRNGRIYPRELWENVLNSDYVKEMIESHGLVGELDHPEERLEISLQNVSHVINDMWIEGDQVVGTIDILPTPSGKIVSELLDYGTDIGISSRGAGSVGPNNVVDPDYQFVTFDFVARPSCEAARLNTILESVKPEIESNTDDKVNAILEGYKTSLKESKSFFGHTIEDDLEEYGGPVGFDRFYQRAIDFGVEDEAFETYGSRSQSNVEKVIKNYYKEYKNAFKKNLKESESLLDKYKLNGDDRFRYMMLSRLQSDCKYVLGAAEGNTRHLWVKDDIKTHCALMRELYNSLPEKPDWISLEDIDNYEKEMSKYHDNLKEGHNQEDINMTFVDMCKDALSDELGPDWRHKSLSDIEDIVHDTVFKYNEANVQPEYEDEDFYGDEADARAIYRYILDNEIPAENKTTETRPMDESHELDKATGYINFEIPAYNIRGLFNKETKEVIYFTKFGSREEEHKTTYDELNNEEFPYTYSGIVKKYIDTKILSGDMINEAVMSDQEVFKTVLEWYKNNIETGKMTLNQCYELLSDKAKVSLNKMVDQSKIKESLINETINKLIKESIELNKRD